MMQRSQIETTYAKLQGLTATPMPAATSIKDEEHNTLCPCRLLLILAVQPRCATHNAATDY